MYQKYTVPEIWCAMDRWTDGRTDGHKKWHIEVVPHLKNGNLINCYQSYLTYYLLIFQIYQNILLQRGNFYCTRPDTFCYKTQSGLNMANVIIWHLINLCSDPMIYIGLKKEYSTLDNCVCVSYELTLHLPRKVHCYNSVAS